MKDSKYGKWIPIALQGAGPEDPAKECNTALGYVTDKEALIMGHLRRLTRQAREMKQMLMERNNSLGSASERRALNDHLSWLRRKRRAWTRLRRMANQEKYDLLGHAV